MVRATFTMPFSTDQLQHMLALDAQRTRVWDEFKATRALIHKGQLRTSPYPYLQSGRPNGGVVNTLHAAATALDTWFKRSAYCLDSSLVMSTRSLLADIKESANKVPIITDPYEGEDDSQYFVGEWTQLMRMFASSVRDSRLMRVRGERLSAPDFMIFPPRGLLICS